VTSEPGGARFYPDIVRFLRQATFGPTNTLLNHVQEIGFEAYLEEQFASPGAPYLDLIFGPQNPPGGCGAGSVCNRERYTMFLLQKRFFTDALLGGEHQLRQRMSFAFQQIFNVSGVPPLGQASWIQEYVKAVENNAFGNYRQMLYEVAVNPAMGRYLDMMGNRRFNPEIGIRPNENFARELMQLFTTGLYEMYLDGTYVLDKEGNRIPVYTQADIEELSRVCTGWVRASDLQPGNLPNYRDAMVALEAEHDAGSKTLLGVEIPEGLRTEDDLNYALDIVFNNWNTPIFIAKRLIQHFVTSNPAPEYAARVALAFIDNGAGVRGDLKAVIRAVLLDAEARGDFRAEANYGKLQEPVLFVANVLRAFGARSDGVLNPQTAAQGQSLLTPPDVFGFYDPFYRMDETGQLGPVFAILSTQTALARANLADQLLFGQVPAVAGGSGGTTIQDGLLAYRDMATDPAALVDVLNNLLLHGAMAPATRATVLAAVGDLPGDTDGQRLLRARTAAYLILVSPQYQIQR